MRNVDFLGKIFEQFKCSRCRRVFRRMAMDDKIKTCPKCMNERNEDETRMGH